MANRRKSSDPLDQFVNLRTALMKEREVIKARLQDIEAALGGDSGSEDLTPTQAESPGSTGPAWRNPLSLRDAIIQVLAEGPRTKPEILRAVQALGYRFTAKNPMNSLNVMLYGSKNPRFKRASGRFSVQRAASRSARGARRRKSRRSAPASDQAATSAQE